MVAEKGRSCQRRMGFWLLGLCSWMPSSLAAISRTSTSGRSAPHHTVAWWTGSVSPTG
jgi:hypothetical protein